MLIRTRSYRFSGMMNIFQKLLHLSLDIIFIIRFQNKLEVGIGLQASQLVRLEQAFHLRQVLAELNACGQKAASASSSSEPHPRTAEERLSLSPYLKRTPCAAGRARSQPSRVPDSPQRALGEAACSSHGPANSQSIQTFPRPETVCFLHRYVAPPAWESNYPHLKTSMSNNHIFSHLGNNFVEILS